ncbi:MAG: DUF4956 domain-containing protein [Chloroflexota bacterium]
MARKNDPGAVITDPLPIREITYLFIIAALPVMNSVGLAGENWPQVVAANLAILAILLMLEKEWGFHYEASKRIVYEKIELTHPDRYAELLADLETRTGLKIKRIVIGKVNFLRDIANLKIYYEDPSQEIWVSHNGFEQIVPGEDDADEFAA